MDNRPIRIIKGRGTSLRPQPRYDRETREFVDDGWTAHDAATTDDGAAPELPAPKTVVVERKAKSIITRNDSPDLPFTQSINPYLGCEHGCIYCYARPSYAYWDMSPGLDFETKLFAKTNAAQLLREELGRKSYRCEPLVLGANTDGYQPVEREWRITRQIVEILAAARHPLIIITKSSLVERDLDLLAPMAAQGLVLVCVSLSLVDGELARRLEPRAAAPHRRLQTMRALSAAGVPVNVIVAPIIPQLNDKDIEAVLESARAAGATCASHVLLRLPHEIKILFRDWLQQHYPLRAAHIMSIVQQTHGGKDYDAAFGKRMTGEGLFAELIAQRFAKACARLGFTARSMDLRTDLFVPPKPADASPQLDLFGS